MHCFGAWMTRLVRIRPCKTHAKYATRHALTYCAVLNASNTPDSGITYPVVVPLRQEPIRYVASIAMPYMPIAATNPPTYPYCASIKEY